MTLPQVESELAPDPGPAIGSLKQPTGPFIRDKSEPTFPAGEVLDWRKQVNERLDGLGEILKAHTRHLAANDEHLAALILGQTAMMETLDLLMSKLAEFEERAEPLLRKAEQRGRLFGGAKSQNPMDRGV